MVRFTTQAVLLLVAFTVLAEERKTTESFLEETSIASSIGYVELFEYARPECESNCILTVKGAYQTMVINIDDTGRVLSKPTIYEELLEVDNQRPLVLPSFKDVYLLEVGEHMYPILVLPNGAPIFGEHISSSERHYMTGGGFNSDDCAEKKEVDYHSCVTHSDGTVTMTLIENVYDCNGNFLRQDIYRFTIPANLAGEYVWNCED